MSQTLMLVERRRRDSDDSGRPNQTGLDCRSCVSWNLVSAGEGDERCVWQRRKQRRRGLTIYGTRSVTSDRPIAKQSLRALVSKGRTTRWLLRIVEALCASQCSGLRSSSSCGKGRIRHALHVSVCDGTMRKRTTGNSKEELRHHRGRRRGCSRLGRCPWAGRRGSPRRVPGERRRRGQQARRNRRRLGGRADGLLS